MILSLNEIYIMDKRLIKKANLEKLLTLKNANNFIFFLNNCIINKSNKLSKYDRS